MSVESCEYHFPIITALATDNPYDAAVIRAQLDLPPDSNVPELVQKELFEIGQLLTRDRLGRMKEEVVKALQEMYEASNLDDLVQKLREGSKDPKGMAAWVRDKAKGLFKDTIPTLKRANDLFTFGPGNQVDVRSGWRDIRLGPLKFVSTDPVDGQHLQEIVEIRAVTHVRLGYLENGGVGEGVKDTVKRFYPNLTEEDEITLIVFAT